MPSLQRNVALYPWFRMAADGYAWIAVFFLYMSQSQSLDQVVQLSAIYYLSVFVVEVPSGYFSDRFGRRTTLLIATGALMLSYACFIIGGGFAWFAAGQFFLATGIAMQSGTDTAFHYDSLKALGRESEYAQREARAEQWGLIMTAVATLIGGALGLIDLRLAYVYSLVSAIAMGLLVWRFVEPVHASESAVPTRGFWRVLLDCLGRLRDPVLGWIFAVAITLYALAHIVYEFYQPYISLLQMPAFDLGEYASLISGIVIGLSMFGGAVGARLSIGWLARFGLTGVIGIASLLQLATIAAMAAVFHPLVLILVFTRNFPMALIHAPVMSAIAPRIERTQRATYLSIQSLSERLAFALLLFLLAADLKPAEAVSEAALGGILSSTMILGVAALALLFLSRGRVRRALAEPARDDQLR